MQALFARHRTYVYRWLLRFVSNETLAEDLLSEVFLDVWRQSLWQVARNDDCRALSDTPLCNSQSVRKQRVLRTRFAEVGDADR
jgi:hypothetical protein